MRWTRLILGSVVGVWLGVSATHSPAYVDSGSDPQGDHSSETGAYDISSTTRSVVHGTRRTNLRIATRTYDFDFSVESYIYVDAKLDARGGRRADAVLHVWIEDMSGSGCQLETRSGRLIRRGSLTVLGQSSGDEPPSYRGVRCRVAAHRLHPTKEIRWRVAVIHPSGETWDVAPNDGMYS